MVAYYICTGNSIFHTELLYNVPSDMSKLTHFAGYRSYRKLMKVRGNYRNFMHDVTHNYRN